MKTESSILINNIKDRHNSKRYFKIFRKTLDIKVTRITSNFKIKQIIETENTVYKHISTIYL